MNEKELAEIEARAEAATPGPWASNKYFWNVVTNGGVIVANIVGTSYAEQSKDQEFIAHSREDVPALVAEVRRMTKRSNNLFRGIKDMARQTHPVWVAMNESNQFLRAENIRLRAALDKYADDKNWRKSWTTGDINIFDGSVGWEIAQDALKGGAQ